MPKKDTEMPFRHVLLHSITLHWFFLRLDWLYCLCHWFLYTHLHIHLQYNIARHWKKKKEKNT